MGRAFPLEFTLQRVPRPNQPKLELQRGGVVRGFNGGGQVEALRFTGGEAGDDRAVIRAQPPVGNGADVGFRLQPLTGAT